MSLKMGRPAHQFEALMRSIQDDWIFEGQAGERMPSQIELKKQYGASSKTIKAVLKELAHRGEIIWKPYGGIHVSGSAHLPWSDYLGKFIGFSPYSVLWYENAFARSVFDGARERMRALGINLAVATRPYARRIDGLRIPLGLFGSPDLVALLILGPDLFQKFTKPRVVVDMDVSAAGVDSFCFDNAGAGELLVRRLLHLGHRRFAMVVEDPGKPAAEKDEAWSERRAGVLSALSKAKTSLPVELALSNRGGIRHVLPALRDLLQKPTSARPTALILPWDGVAGVRKLTTELSLKIPRDLSVVGFSGTEAEGEMTAVRFDGSKLGHNATHHLLTCLQDPKWKARKAKRHDVKGKYVAGKTHARAPV